MNKKLITEQLARLEKYTTIAERMVLAEFFTCFCDTGVIYLTNLILNARMAQKPWQDVWGALNVEWARVWSLGTPDRIGDPDDVTTIPAQPKHTGPLQSFGLHNTVAYFRVYESLGLPRPKGLY